MQSISPMGALFNQIIEEVELLGLYIIGKQKPACIPGFVDVRQVGHQRPHVRRRTYLQQALVSSTHDWHLAVFSDQWGGGCVDSGSYWIYQPLDMPMRDSCCGLRLEDSKKRLFEARVEFG